MPISRLFTSCFPSLFQSRRVLAPDSAEARRGNFISALLNRWFHRSRSPSWGFAAHAVSCPMSSDS